MFLNIVEEEEDILEKRNGITGIDFENLFLIPNFARKHHLIGTSLVSQHIWKDFRDIVS